MNDIECYGEDTECVECGQDCTLEVVDYSFYYSGAHCTNGLDGTHTVPVFHVSECCGADFVVVERRFK